MEAIVPTAAVSSKLVDRIKDLEVLSIASKKSVRLETLWQAFDVTYVKLLRRFGCALCRLGALQTNDLVDYYKEKFPGTKVGFVGIAFELVGYKEFVEGKFFPGEIYLDETRNIYNRLGLPRGNCCDLISCKVWSKERQASARGLQSTSEGDGWQFGGVLVVTKRSDIILYYPQQFYGDEPENEEVQKVMDNYLIQSAMSKSTIDKAPTRA